MKLKETADRLRKLGKELDDNYPNIDWIKTMQTTIHPDDAAFAIDQFLQTANELLPKLFPAPSDDQ